MARLLANLLRQRFSLRALLFSLVVGFIWGMATFLVNIFPYTFLKEAESGAIAVRDMLTGKLPWYYISTNLTHRIDRSLPENMQPGLTVITGVSENQIHTIKIIDNNGLQIHKWDVDWFTIWPDAEHLPPDLAPQSRPGASVHGTVVLPDGSVVVNFEYLGMVRLSLCGDVLWRLPYQAHHSLSMTERGTFWASGRITHKKPLESFPGYQPLFYEETAIEVSPNGQILREISVFDVLVKNDLMGLLYMTDALPRSGDTLHLNDVEEFPELLDEGTFHHGDLMISLNFINTVLVFDAETLEKRFVSIGRFAHQHDPDFIDGNNILVFNNNMIENSESNGSSRIENLSAPSGETSVIFAGTPGEPFYSSAQGKHQQLMNGNLLITETRRGRVFELDQDGNVVWEYYNLTDDGVLGIVEDAQRLDKETGEIFFGSTIEECGEGVPL